MARHIPPRLVAATLIATAVFLAALVPVLTHAAHPALFPAALTLLLIETLKVAWIVRRSDAQRADSQQTDSKTNNGVPPALAAETATLMLDVALLALLFHLTQPELRATTLLTFCALFAASRIAAWLVLSHHLWK